MASTVQVDKILNPLGSTVFDTSVAKAGSYAISKIDTQVDTSARSATTAWVLGPTFTTITDIPGNSILSVYYIVPDRNDTVTWGGLYIEPQVSFNGGAWESLGSCGYDGGTMLTGASIGSYNNLLTIDPGLGSTFTAQFRFYFKSYVGTTTINSTNDLNNISGTAALMAGNNGLQHYMSMTVTCYSKIS